tara:strand:- start:426 stop:1316 length:891 start_codon:yes stop_codon:yes gene_type:complete
LSKGIILAGGKGSRLSPLTNVISKQLIPIYDKPMIYYPLGTLMLSGIKEFLVITTPQQYNLYKSLLKDGSQWGISFEYAIQNNPNGIAEAFIIGEKFINNSNIVFILGDNLFHGNQLIPLLQQAANSKGATLLAYKVNDPERYGVVEFDKFENVLSLEEKPSSPKSNYAITGLYFYDEKVVEYAKRINFSERKELEITDINKFYLNKGNLKVKLIGRGTAWLDTGTIDSLHEASSYIRTLENRQGLKISCPEEIAWRNNWINSDQLESLAKEIKNSEYGKYLLKLLKENQIEKELS